MRLLNAYLQHKFIAKGVTEVSFFQATTSRSRAVVSGVSSGFIMLRLARVVSQFPAQYFGKEIGFNIWKLILLSGVFPTFVGHFFKRARKRDFK